MDDSVSAGYGEPDKERDDEDAEEVVEEIRARWKEAKDGLADWRKEAREDFAFRAGHQWDPKDIAKLNDQERPAVTFNRIGAMVDAVSGLEINNRQEVKYFPREQGDVGADEIFTAAGKWARDNCYGEDEETEAFDDAATCGVGCTETSMDYEEDPEGLIRIDRKDPLMMLWDPAATKKNLSDARYVFNAVWMDREDAEDRWPDAEDALSVDELMLSSSGDGQPHNADRAFLYEGATNDDKEIRKNQVLVLHYQCYKLEPIYRCLDPFAKKIKEFSEDEFKRLEKNIGEIGMELVGAGTQTKPNQVPYVKQNRKKYHRAFLIGDTLLDSGPSPCQHGFTFKFITGKRDRNKGTWYGIVRPMKDPQRWGNKFFSQVLDIVAKNTKGGAFVEEGALVDKAKAEEQWASASPLILLREGSVSQGKIKERQAAGYPTGIDRLMTFAFEALPYVSGIPLETMGLTGKDQAGVVEQGRKQSAMAILAPLFDSLRRYRKEQGRVLLYFIQEYISDGRLIRVLGKGGITKYLPLTKDPKALEYDIVVDQAPTSPDFREKTWAALNAVLPIMLKQGYPIPPSVFQYAPLPADVAAELSQYAQGYVPPAIQQQLQSMQQAVQKSQQQVQDLTQQLQTVQSDRSLEAAEIKRKDVDSQRRANVKLAAVTAESQEAQAAGERAQAETTRDALATVADLEIKAKDAQTRAEAARHAASQSQQS